MNIYEYLGFEYFEFVNNENQCITITTNIIRIKIRTIN